MLRPTERASAWLVAPFAIALTEKTVGNPQSTRTSPRSCNPCHQVPNAPFELKSLFMFLVHGSGNSETHQDEPLQFLEDHS